MKTIKFKRVGLILIIALVSCSKVSNLPVVSTTKPIMSNERIFAGGEVTDAGGDKNTLRGVCWKMGSTPTTLDNVRLDTDKGLGDYSLDITNDLVLNKDYFLRAFAENKLGISYGEEMKFSFYGNPKNAFINNSGCIQCDNYNVGDTFSIDLNIYVVANKNMIKNAINNGKDLSIFCTSKIQNMESLFFNVDSNVDITTWDVSKVTTMKEMFYSSNFNGNITNWDVSNVKNMHSMFESSNFNQDIGNWNVSEVEDMGLMFDAASDFNQDIGDWNVSKVVDMENLFNYATNFNQDIGMWDVSNVTNMKRLVSNAPYFNQDLSNWCVTKITQAPYKFSENSGLSSSNHPVWGTCP